MTHRSLHPNENVSASELKSLHSSLIVRVRVARVAHGCVGENRRQQPQLGQADAGPSIACRGWVRLIHRHRDMSADRLSQA